MLLRAIDSEFATGAVIPNERELSARFGVARATLRQALDQLELEGRLVRRRGIGTLVAAPRVGVPVSRREEGEAWQAVDCASAPAADKLAQALGIPAGALVHTVRRVRVEQGQTVATERLHVPDSALEQVPEIRLSGAAASAEDQGRAVLRRLERLTMDGESRAVELGVAEAEEAALLLRPPGTPVLVVTTQYASGGRLAALAVSTYRADTCRLTFGETGLVEVLPAAPVRTAS